MQRFKYKAKEGPAKIVNGFVNAENADAAINKINQLGLMPIDVSVADNSQKNLKKNFSIPQIASLQFIKKVKFNDVVIFTRQISDLVDAAVSILRALQIISNQTKNQDFKKIILNMHTVVRDGGAFSDAMSKNKDIFSPLYINMVRSGEAGGNLSDVLNRLAVYLEKEQGTRGKIKASLAYPALILVVGFITIFVLLAFVIPRLSIMFDDLNQSLPLPTLILINVSNIFARIWWLILGLLAAGGFSFKKWVNTDGGRMRFDSFKLKVPFLGDFIKTVEVERFARTLAAQIETGVSITDALKSVTAVVGNRQLYNELKNISLDVANGESLKNTLGKSRLFPQMAANMIAVGEETGRLERGLYKVADTFERQIDQIVKTMISLLGPLVLVVIVSFVGFVVIAMLLPIFQMNLLIQ